MGLGILGAAISGGAQAMDAMLTDRIKAEDAQRLQLSAVQARRAELLFEMEAKSRWARQDRMEQTAAVGERLQSDAGQALAQRYAQPQAGDTSLTPEQAAAQAQGLERQELAMGRDRAAYMADPTNMLRASIAAGYSEPDALAKLDNTADIARARLESQQQLAQVRSQADAEKQQSRVDVALARIDAQSRARTPAGYRETPDGNLEPVPGGPADQKRSGAFNADTAQLASSADGLNRLANSANSLMNHPGLAGIVGLKGKFPNMPGGDAADAAAQLETLKSQVGFGVLQAMRDASKTGGALGAVSDAEGKRLEANLAALSQAQSLDQFKSSLRAIMDYSEAAKDRLRGSFNLKHGAGAGGADPAAPAPQGASRPPRISSPAELANLPAGALFTAPDGSIRRKP